MGIWRKVRREWKRWDSGQINGTWVAKGKVLNETEPLAMRTRGMAWKRAKFPEWIIRRMREAESHVLQVWTKARVEARGRAYAR